MHGGAATERHHGGVQRVVGCGDEHFIAAVEQRVHAHGDQFRSAVAQVNVVHRHTGHPLFLRVVHHRFARRKQALAVGVTRRVRQVANHVLHDFIGRLNAKCSNVADVELDDALAFFFHLPRFVEHGTTDVIAHMG